MKSLGFLFFKVEALEAMRIALDDLWFIAQDDFRIADEAEILREAAFKLMVT